MLTDNLTGAMLDFWVATADKRLNPHIVGGECLFTHGEGGPTVRWDEAFFCVQIMPREFPGLLPGPRAAMEVYMRQFVRRRFGDTVPEDEP